MIRQSDTNAKLITLWGMIIANIAQELEEYLANKFPDFEVFFVNIDSPLLTQQKTSDMPTVEKWSPDSLYATTWSSDEFCRIELLVKAKQNNRAEPNPLEAIYAVVPAHLVMSVPLRRDAASVDYGVLRARHETEKETTRQRYIYKKKVGSETKMIDLRHPPLLVYRQWCHDRGERCPAEHPKCGESSQCPHHYLSDMALLQVDNDTLPPSEIPQSSGQKQLSAFAKLKDIKRLKDKLIVIGGKKGRILSHHVSPERSEGQPKEFYGHHIYFALTSTCAVENTK